jgi:LPPG:FO 2-phospho-L-lactate transferase
MIVALAGGVGAARFLDGLTRVMPPEKVYIIGNTGDDLELLGLHISPDLDTVMYTLAGVADRERGWGLDGDTFQCLSALAELGHEGWFLLGDRDLATHLFRTERLRAGQSLGVVTRDLARRIGLRSVLAPMCDQAVRTMVQTRHGFLEFQDYFVRRRARDAVLGVEFRGATLAVAPPATLKAIRSASGIVFCPSNPIISIGPILAVPGLRNALENRKCPALAISPIVGGKALKGPAASMLRSMGRESSARGVAEMYRGLVDIFVLDHADRQLVPSIEALGMRAVVTNTIMSGIVQKKALARKVLKSLEAA